MFVHSVWALEFFDQTNPLGELYLNYQIILIFLNLATNGEGNELPPLVALRHVAAVQ